LELATSDHIFIINGDTFFDVDLQQLLKHHLSTESEMTIALKPMKEFDRYGTVGLLNGSIVTLAEKGYQSEGYINGGIYVAGRTLFDRFNLPEKFSFEKDFLAKYLDFLKICGFIADAFFIDIGILEDYERAKIELPKYWEANCLE